MAAEETVETCADCGATVYPEHIQKNMAARLEGKLLCAHCLRDRRTAAAQAAAPAANAAPPSAAPAGEPIELIEIDAGGGEGGSLIDYEKKPTVLRTMGGGLHGAIAEQHFRRGLLAGSPNATRSRVFHAKLADAAFNHMTDQINEWADSDESIEIKFATSCIGVVEGKHADPHLIVTVFY